MVYRPMDEERHACHTAGIALHLIECLPPSSSQPTGQGNLADHVRDLAGAVVLVLPSHLGISFPEDRTKWLRRVTVAHELLVHARECSGSLEHPSLSTLVEIAQGALRDYAGTVADE